MSGNKNLNKMKREVSHWRIITLTVFFVLINIVIAALSLLFNLIGWGVIVLILLSVLYIVIIEKYFKSYIKKLTYRLKHGIAKHEWMISIYTVLIAAVFIAIYEILLLVGKDVPLLPLIIERKEYYAIVISLCSLVVALLLSLKLDIKKIESGEDFLAALRLHAKDLQRINPKEELHIYSPNINIGVSDIIQHNQKHCTMYNIISECDQVKFIFHCPYYSQDIKNAIEEIIGTRQEGTFFRFSSKASGNKMLDYLLRNYFNVEIHGNINELARVCMIDLKDMLSYGEDKVVFKPCDEIEEKMVGFRSKYKMVLGKYSDIVENKHTGEVGFHGEVVTIPEFIDFVPKIKEWD